MPQLTTVVTHVLLVHPANHCQFSNKRCRRAILCSGAINQREKYFTLSNTSPTIWIACDWLIVYCLIFLSLRSCVPPERPFSTKLIIVDTFVKVLNSFFFIRLLGRATASLSYPRQMTSKFEVSVVLGLFVTLPSQAVAQHATGIETEMCSVNRTVFVSLEVPDSAQTLHGPDFCAPNSSRLWAQTLDIIYQHVILSTLWSASSHAFAEIRR